MQFRRQTKSHPTAANSAWSFRGVVAAMAVFLCFSAIAAPISVDRAVLVKDGVARAAILVPARILDDPKVNPEPASVWRSLRPEDNRRRLRESVRDLAAVLQRISGAEIEILAGPPAGDEKRLPILIGELAAQRFGKPEKTYP